MFPSVEIFGRTFYTYALLAIAGILIAGFLMCRLAAKRGLDINELLIVVVIALLGGFIGSHILYGITNLHELYLFGNVTDLGSLKYALSVVFGGAVFYGGLIGGIIAGLITLKAKKLDIAAYSDVVAPAIPLFHGIARIGCFLGGCCYGVECEFGFEYTHALIESANGVIRFPVQLLEALCNFTICIVLCLLLKKNKLRGRLFYLYLMTYSVVRFLDEFLRGDELRGFVGIISTSQFVSLLLFIGGSAAFIISRNKHINHIGED